MYVLPLLGPYLVYMTLKDKVNIPQFNTITLMYV